MFVTHRMLLAMSTRVLWLLFASTALSAHAGPPGAPAAATPSVGVVDGAPFARLAGEDDDLSEVELQPVVLRALARGAQEGDAKKLLSRLELVRAVVVGVDAKRLPEAQRVLDATAADLLAGGWTELARVRERGSRVRVLTRMSGGDRLAGLVVLMAEGKAVGEATDGGAPRAEVIFANIAGNFDLAELAGLGGRLDLPGLDRVLGARGQAGWSGAAPRKDGGAP